MHIIPQRVVLVIMDGWGHAADAASNAIRKARTPFVDSLYEHYPHSFLRTSGEDVGLPHGQMGNSEVGHLNIGAGRVVLQELMRINEAIRSGELKANDTLAGAFENCIRKDKPLHLMGLISDGGVHSHMDHMVSLCALAHDAGVRKIFVHAFTDGRDTDPHSGAGFLEQVSRTIEPFNAQIVSVIGRYFAMDRDKRWERVKKAYDLLTHGTGRSFETALQGIKASYESGITDEFIEPIITGAEDSRITNGDTVICFNFRTDRCREITEVLTQRDMPEQEMRRLDLHYITMTMYDSRYRDVNVIFEKDDISETIGEVLSRAGKKQLRIAETEKYPHVTFFFSGGVEKEFDGEERILIPSPKVATYDLKPEMSAYEVTDRLTEAIASDKFDFICVNFANPDMVGHTGDFKAAVKALETVDRCVEKVVETGLAKNYAFIITSDHGNADFMINEDGSPNTAHTTNPVPCFLLSHRNKGTGIRDGRLADIAPTVLELMGLGIPNVMTGSVLLTGDKVTV
jgi:2,3-bisphosphoglycerate-independent phosphoglycerate mutase